MKKRIGIRKCIVLLAGISAFGCLGVTSALAQDMARSEINVQFSSLIPSDSSGNGITNQATKAGGYQAGYGYQFNKWAGGDFSFGSTRYTQNYTGDFGAESVQSNLREFATDFLLHIPDHTSRVHPYAVAGVAAFRFMPTSNVNNAAGAQVETRSAFIYGGGADFDISKKVGVRAEYRGGKFKAADFRLTELDLESQTHISQPSIGIYYRFSGFGIGHKSSSKPGA